MIYTLTFNPAVDYILNIEKFQPESINRASAARFHFGGKGINVSTVLNGFGVENTAFGFVAGFTGAALADSLERKGIKTDFVKLSEGATRINVKISSTAETEINAGGPEITPEALNELFEKLNRLEDGDMLVMSGSVPSNIPEDIYSRIINMQTGKDITFILDAAGSLLMNALPGRPFLIKPSLGELQEFSHDKLETIDEIAILAKTLQEKGARNVLVSMGKDGALLLCENGKVFHAKPQKVKTNYTVGAGDAMLAGFIAGYVQHRDLHNAFFIGSAAGNATAASEGLAEYDKILECMDILEENHNIRDIKI